MTTDTGLTNRLRQHSRRAGLAVGLTMALTIAICVGGFAVIYAQLQPFIRDFVSQEAPVEDAVAVGRRGESDEEDAAAPVDEDADGDGGEDAEGGGEPAAQEEEEPEPTEPPEPTPTPEGFAPDYQSSSDGSINFRGGPGTSFEALFPLPVATPLQFLGEREATQDPDADLLTPGQEWMKFRTEDGTEGWIREIDAEPYDPDA